MKRRSFIMAAAATPLLLSACVTESLYGSIHRNDRRTYTESIDSVLTSADGTKLVFLGVKFHYVFDAPEHFAELLNSPLDAKVEVRTDTFFADENGNVEGYLRMELEKASAEEIAQAVHFGFTPRNASSASVSIALKGKRYSAEGFDASKVDKKLLRRTYEVRVNEPNPFNASKALYALTPITVAADGALWLLGAPLVLAWFIVVYRQYGRR